jgi:hypothetical protein
MSGIDATLSELVFDSALTQRSRWRVNAGLNDFHPVGMLQWIGIDISTTACRVMAKRLRDVCVPPESEPLWRAGHRIIGGVVAKVPSWGRGFR